MKVTPDDDVALLLKKENRRMGEPMKQTVNRVLRSELFPDASPDPRLSSETPDSIA
jgi:hypothetical protein